MNRRGIRAVVRRDLAIVARSRAVMLPLIILPVLFLVLLPAAIAAVVSRLPATVPDEAEGVMARLPADVLAALPEQPGARIAVVAVTFLLPPLTMIVPLMVAQVIATDAIAGERERGTLEGLLLTPLSDRELLVAKLLTALIPALAVELAGALLYTVVVDVLLWPYTHALVLPTAGWLALVLWLGPAVAAAGLGIAVLVSARVGTVQGASQISGVAVLPVVFLALGQVTGLLFVGAGLILVVGVVFWGLAALFAYLSTRMLRRERLGARLAR
ncbi:MAG: ABC transporter permease subunit [Streptosporangiales bacterium]|nr:ABC transporter permease subunit [Streptosporangiales bacterium]